MNKNNMIHVTSTEPYPKIQVEKPNFEYAQILSQDFASPISETTAIYLYLYQNIIFEKSYHKISQIMIKIAESEMHHFHILSKLINLLGTEPRLQSNQNNPFTAWNGNNINYCKNIKEALLYNKSSEEDAIKNYICHAEIIKDKYIPNILLRIVSDEKVHLNIFEKLISYF